MYNIRKYSQIMYQALEKHSHNMYQVLGKHSQLMYQTLEKHSLKRNCTHKTNERYLLIKINSTRLIDGRARWSTWTPVADEFRRS